MASRPDWSRRLGGLVERQQTLYLADRLFVRLEVDGLDPQLPRRLDVHLVVVDEEAAAGLDCAEALQSELVDLRLRLSHSDIGRIHDDLEDVVDGQLAPPAVF